MVNPKRQSTPVAVKVPNKNPNVKYPSLLLHRGLEAGRHV